MRAPSTQKIERDFRALCASVIKGRRDVKERARAGAAFLALLVARRRPAAARAPQLGLWHDSGAPWAEYIRRDPTGFRIVPSPQEVTSPNDLFPCATLHTLKMLAQVCKVRQEESDSRTKDTWRGQSGKYPLCNSNLCADGRCIRSTLDPDYADRLKRTRQRGQARRAASVGGWDSDMPPEQVAARDRAAAQGLLDEPPTLDSELGEVED